MTCMASCIHCMSKTFCNPEKPFTVSVLSWKLSVDTNYGSFNSSCQTWKCPVYILTRLVYVLYMCKYKLISKLCTKAFCAVNTNTTGKLSFQVYKTNYVYLLYTSPSTTSARLPFVVVPFENQS